MRLDAEYDDQLVDLIYATVFGEATWQDFLLKLDEGLPGGMSGLLYHDARQAMGAIESARLLLASASDEFPDGLANSSGQVGRNATFHEYFFAIGLFDRDLHDPVYGWAGNYVNGTSMEFYETDESRGHIAGCVITASGLGPPVNWTFPGRPTWGQAAKDADVAGYIWKGAGVTELVRRCRELLESAE